MLCASNQVKCLLACALFLGIAACEKAEPIEPTVREIELVTAHVLPLMDRSRDPCNDFYHYACGRFTSSTSVASNEHVQLTQLNNAALKAGILPKIRARIPQVEAFYTSCMTDSAEKRQVSLIRFLNNVLGSISDTRGFMVALARVHQEGIAVFFNPRLEAALTSPKTLTLGLHKGELLRNKKFYLSTVQHDQEARDKYLRQVDSALPKNTNFSTTSAAILDLETRLAKLSDEGTNVTRYARYNLASFSSQSGLDTTLWLSYFASFVSDPESRLLVGGHNIQTTELEYLRKVTQLLKTEPLETLVTYLEVRFLLMPFYQRDDESDFAVVPDEPKTTEAICSEVTFRYMWPLLAQEFVGLTPLPSYYAALSKLSEQMRGGVRQTLEHASWLDGYSRGLALQKAASLEINTVIPNGLSAQVLPTASSDNFMDNVIAMRRYGVMNRLDQLGQSADRTAFYNRTEIAGWGAIYQPQLNATSIFAGTMLAPAFEPDFPIAMRFGALGFIMGHEAMHGFDLNGRAYDASGNLRLRFGAALERWSNGAIRAYDQRASCLITAYNRISVAPGLYVDGRLTLNENACDVGGLSAAWQGYRNQVKGSGAVSYIEGMTFDQLFFVAFAQNWCSAIGEEALRKQVSTDVHAPSDARVLGTLQQSPEFAEAFSCPVGSRYNPGERCNMW